MRQLPAAIASFGSLPIPAGVEILGLDLPVGRLTALHAAPTESAAPRTVAPRTVAPRTVVPRTVARGAALLVPGFTGSKEDFLDILPLLAARGWDVWTYSQRGQADSAAPVGEGSYRLEDFALDTVEIARIVGAGRPVHLLGHSLGGIVARAAAIGNPESFADLAMLCSGPHGWAGRHAQDVSVIENSGTGAYWEHGNPQTVGKSDDELTAENAFLRMRMGRTSADNLLAGIRILADPSDTTDALLATGLDVLVAHGVDDTAWPQQWQREMSARLRARYAVIPDAAHSPQQENPAATVRLLDGFWGRP